MAEIKKKVQALTQEYTESTILAPDGFGGWMCVNTGAVDVKVMGVPLQPNKGLDFLIVGETRWQTNIVMEIPAGGSVRVIRLRYS